MGKKARKLNRLESYLYQEVLELRAQAELDRHYKAEMRQKIISLNKECADHLRTAKQLAADLEDAKAELQCGVCGGCHLLKDCGRDWN